MLLISAVYYVLEQVIKMIAKGKQYFVDIRCLYEGIISIALFAIQLAQILMYGSNRSVSGSDVRVCASA